MPPPRRPGPPPQQHYEEPHYAASQPQFIGLSNNDVASKVVDAYKVNPMLTGLLLLNLIIFVGAGYYLNTVQQRTYEYIKERDMREHERTQKMMDMASKCVVPDLPQPRYSQQQYYPQYAPPPPQAPPQPVAPQPPRAALPPSRPQ
jgi:hypothetical protein